MVLSVMDGNGRLTIDEIDIGRSLGACVQCLHSTSDAQTFIHRKDLFALFFFSCYSSDSPSGKNSELLLCI